jgi:NAD(P)-dependent dehydrogenase (short-subunit alcohol dehydrogenase family)
MAGVFRDNLLAGRVAVVTGGGSGINQRIAERYAEHGATVVLVGRTQEKLDEAARSIEAKGGKAVGFAADVRDFAAMSAVMAKARDLHGAIDLVVCGAAGNFPAPAAGLSANGFKAVVDIDLNGTFNTCRAAFEHLTRPGASILAISAPQATDPMEFQAHVCAAKAGVEMLAKTLALEWGPLGVRVNAVVPGPIDDTEGMRRLVPTPEGRARLEEAIPLRRYGTRDDIADVALFLATPATGFVTGAVWVVDGGQSLGGSSGIVRAITG